MWKLTGHTEEEDKILRKKNPHNITAFSNQAYLFKKFKTITARDGIKSPKQAVPLHKMQEQKKTETKSQERPFHKCWMYPHCKSCQLHGCEITEHYPTLKTYGSFCLPLHFIESQVGLGWKGH